MSIEWSLFFECCLLSLAVGGICRLLEDIGYEKTNGWRLLFLFFGVALPANSLIEPAAEMIGMSSNLGRGIATPLVLIPIFGLSFLGDLIAFLLLNGYFATKDAAEQ